MSRARDTADGIARAITDGIIVDADINASAAIAQSKVADLSTTLGGKVDYAMATNTQSGTGSSAYTFVLADANRLTTSTGATAKTFTIPPQSSVVWVNNSIIRVVNYGAGTLTIAGGVGVTVTNATKTLAQFESAALIRTGSDAWTLVPFSGGASNADFSNTATGTYTGYKYVTFNSTGTLTVTKAGLADILIVAGGAGAGTTGGFVGGAGGGGGVLYQSVYLDAISYTAVVGGGGSGGSNGGVSYFRPSSGSLSSPFRLWVPGGGAGASSGGVGTSGQATGGGGSNNTGGTAGFTNTYGGDGSNYSSGGAGGSATANSDAGTGAGIFNSITGSSVEYGRGNFFTGVSPTANTGRGGIVSAGSGASGVIIVRVSV